MRTMFKGLAFCVLLASGVTAGDYFTDAGSVWTGGNFTWISENVRGSGTQLNAVQIAPMLRFFPCKYLVLGLDVSWLGEGEQYSDGSTGMGSFCIGPEWGFAYSAKPTVPYIMSGVQFMHNYYSTSYNGGLGGTNNTQNMDGYKITLSGGVMVLIADGIGMQMEAGYNYNHLHMAGSGNQEMGQFVLSIGFCGVGKHVAISLLSGLLMP